MKKIAIIALNVFCLSAACYAGKDETNPFKEVLKAVPSAELPSKAAQVVQSAKARDRQATTKDVVRAAVEINPAAAPAIVSAIARAVPEVAALAAGVAASEQPKQAAAICRAATAAAPSKAGKIVAAVCKAVPNEYRAIALAAAEAAPGSGKEILDAVGSAIPGLRPYIGVSSAGFGGSSMSAPTVAAALDQATISQSKAASAPVLASAPTIASGPAAGPVLRGGPAARGPAVGPPYIPLSGTPTNTTPGNGGEVPPGGRNYAAP